MKYKKLSLLASILLSTTILSASSVQKTAFVGVATSTLENEVLEEFVLGWGVDKTYNNNFIFGFDNEYSFGKAKFDSNEKSNVNSIIFDLKTGYALSKNVSLFALGSVIGQYIESDAAYGFGGGAGMDYSFNDSVLIDVRYKAYSMKHTLFDYNYEQMLFSLRYKF